MKIPMEPKHICGVVSLLLVAACAGVSPVEMVPTKLVPGQISTTPENLRVGIVTGGVDPKSYGLTNDHLRVALTSALSKAARKVSASPLERPDTPLELRATIISQRYTKVSTGIETRRELVVAYELFDTTRGRSVWRETYQSEFSSSALGGKTRHNEAIEGSTRESITSLVQGLAEYFRQYGVRAN